MTFDQCAAANIKAHRAGLEQRETRQAMGRPAQYLASCRSRPSNVGLVLKVLEPVWKPKNVTASRLRGRIESILDWAKVHG